MSDSHSIKGKAALVGGGAKNLGGLISRDLATQGARAVLIHYNSDASRAAAEETAAAVKDLGAEAALFQSDLTKPKNCIALFEDAVAKFGQVDIAVNTTGMVIKKPMVEVTEEEYDQIFAINSKAAFFFLQAAGKMMADHGKVVTLGTSLLGALTGYYSPYAGSKAPVEHFTRAAAKEFGARGISVNTVAPGPMDTPFFYPAETPESVEYLKGASMNGELTKIEDVIPLVRLLVGEGWWITGQTIFINGGFTTR